MVIIEYPIKGKCKEKAVFTIKVYHLLSSAITDLFSSIRLQHSLRGQLENSEIVLSRLCDSFVLLYRAFTAGKGADL